MSSFYNWVKCYTSDLNEIIAIIFDQKKRYIEYNKGLNADIQL